MTGHRRTRAAHRATSDRATRPLLVTILVLLVGYGVVWVAMNDYLIRGAL